MAFQSFISVAETFTCFNKLKEQSFPFTFHMLAEGGTTLLENRFPAVCVDVRKGCNVLEKLNQVMIQYVEPRLYKYIAIQSLAFSLSLILLSDEMEADCCYQVPSLDLSGDPVNNTCVNLISSTLSPHLDLCRCLVERGDVAFVKHLTVPENTGGMCTCSSVLLMSRATGFTGTQG